ncbi:PREDICTED: protein SPT2 homolog [Trachymyrmex cornetzi]|uniref:Uncharacterized protein n=1 Tax=Trachymyrmex cornetzi TaxID=471704 RepID=A0A151JCW0_9HYME|nr:PREDICTED: protein SPT2 homolog [Trachymyrmex cornetzi]KYN23496.1 hypothetical protein ALC57_04080 [Trachymyrmex cornetzi]
MFLMLSRILSRSNCILILIIFNLASSAPLKSQRNSPFQNEQGFSASPKILEIQLPLKITSKEDLVAWSKYVMNLMASKINLPSIFKNSPSVEKRLPFTSNSGSKSKEIMKKASLNEKRQGVNYPARRLKEPPLQRPDDKVIAYPLPIGAMQTTSSISQDPSSLSTSNINGPTDFGQYMDFNIGNPFQQSEIDTFGNFDAFLPPANTYLPLPPINIIQSYQNAIDKNISDFKEPAKLQTTRNSLNLHIHNDELQQTLPTVVNNELTGLNLSHNIGEPLLTFPFQAVITIAKELPIATMIPMMQSKDYTAVRNFPNEFLPYFENDYTLTNNSERVNVVFNDFVTETSETKTEGKVKKGKQKEEQKQQNINEQKKQNPKKKNTSKQKSSIKRQSAILGDLLRMLGILRKLPKNSTEINIAKPVLSILKGTNTQKIQVAFEETPPNRGRRNETFQAQQLDEDDDENDDNGNGANGNGDNGNGDNENDDIENDEDDDDGPQTEAQEEDEEEEGGSIQALIELLPLAAPILEELSDPESDVDIVEVLQGAIPLLEGLSDPEEEGGVDIPAVLLPLSQKLSEGPEGQGSDSGAILGPIIQLIAPLSGPLSGPLLGPLSRSSSGPEGVQGSASVFAASGEPLSKPQGPYGQSVLSGLIAGITAKLSKESAASASESDVKSLVSSIVTGVLAGASAGSKGHKSYGYNQYGNAGYGQNGYTGNRDTSHASTTYGGYNSYGKPEAPSGSDLTGPLKEVLGAFLKLSATSATSSANLSGTSSSSSAGLSAGSSQSSEEPEKPTYGPPTNPPYSPPPPPPSRPSYAVPPSTNSPYVSFTRRQVLRQPIKKI